MKTKVLLIEDAIDIAICMIAHLGDAFEVTHTVDDVALIEETIPKVDIVICDYHFSAKLTFEKVVAMVNGRKPVILCSGDPSVSYKNKVEKCEIIPKLKPVIHSLLQGVRQ